jgi:DNA-binding NtrC family response regulator
MGERVLGRRILVVDDALGVRESIRLLLEPEFEVVTAESVAAALASIREARPDLVLLDLVMPGGSGFDLLQHTSAQPDPLPVIIVSATRSISTAVDAMKSGAVDFILKPFGADELRAKVRAGLRGKALVPR